VKLKLDGEIYTKKDFLRENMTLKYYFRKQKNNTLFIPNRMLSSYHINLLIKENTKMKLNKYIESSITE
jgi:hypothetical protein